MKKGLILLAGILVACLPGIVTAGMNPNSYGLVTVNTTSAFPASDCNYYSNNLGTAVVNNNGSVMCVACHTRNPARLAGSAKNITGYMAGSHFVTRNFNDTNKGGGYPDGRGARGGTGSAAHQYMAEATINWAAAPQYGRLTGGAIDCDIIASSTGSVVDGAQMICYSCHSLHSNTGTAARLRANGAPVLGSPYNTATVDNAYLCISCHGDMSAAIAAEWTIHPLDNTVTPNETNPGTHHHRNSHSVSAITNAAYKGGVDVTGLSIITTCPSGAAPAGSYNMGMMCDSFYNQAAPGGVTNAIWQMWAINKGNLGTTANPNHTALQFTGERLIGSAPDNGWIRPGRSGRVNTGLGQGVVICVDCHRGHFGDSSTGALVLIKGGAAAAPSDPFTTAMGSGTNQLNTAGDGWRGAQRMSDVGGRSTTLNGGNLNVNCLVCHK